MSGIRNRSGSSLNLDTTVVGLQGHPISPTGPTSGQALVFDGTDWVPTTVQTGGGGAAVGPTPPSGPNEGDLWFNTGDNTLNVWNGSAWVPVDSSNAIVQINNVLPNNPATGELYWDLITAKLFLWDGLQWVAVINTPDVGPPGPAGPTGAAGPAGPAGATGPAGPAPTPPFNGPIIGVTDGSNAAAGMVGEFISSVLAQGGGVSIPTTMALTFTITSINLTPGDWDVYAEPWFFGGGGGGTEWTTLIVGISNSANLPNSPATNVSRQAFNAPQNTIGFNNAQFIQLQLRCRISTATPVTMYLTGNASWASVLPSPAGPTAGGVLAARRVR